MPCSLSVVLKQHFLIWKWKEACLFPSSGVRVSSKYITLTKLSQTALIASESFSHRAGMGEWLKKCGNCLACGQQLIRMWDHLASTFLFSIFRASVETPRQQKSWVNILFNTDGLKSCPCHTSCGSRTLKMFPQDPHALIIQSNLGAAVKAHCRCK